MPNNETEALRRENERLKTKFADLKELQDDLWSHEIYVKARRKMTVGVIAVLGVLSAIGAFTAYDIYTKLVQYSSDEAKKSINAKIDDKVDEMIDKAQTRLDEKLESSIEVILLETEKRFTSRLKKLEQSAMGRIEELEKTAGDAEKVAKRLKDFVIAGKDQQPSLVEVSRRPEADPACDPLNLTENEIGFLIIKQTSKKVEAGTPSGEAKRKGGPSSEKSYFRNNFSVQLMQKDGTQLPATLEACILEGVDRVVYSLNKYWFSPNEIVRIEKSKKFAFTMDVWGVTPVDITVYLKGIQPPLHFSGNFSLGEDRNIKSQ